MNNNKSIFNSRLAKNYLIDALLLLSFSGLLGIGFLIKYVLLTGEQKRLKFGANFEQTLFGLDRHSWGNIHLYLGFIFLGLLLLHIILHWNVIIAMFKNVFGQAGFSKTIAALFVSLCFLMIVIPFLLQPERGPIEHKRNYRSDKISEANDDAVMKNEVTEESSENPETEHKGTYRSGLLETGSESHKKRQLDIRGYMTISELCRNYHFPESYLKSKLHLPAGIEGNTTLSTLRKEYGIRMRVIEAIMLNYPGLKTANHQSKN